MTGILSGDTEIRQVTPIERLLILSPWEQISEEDFFWVSGLYVSIRGRYGHPKGAYFCANQRVAETLLKQGDRLPPPSGVFVLAFAADVDAASRVAPRGAEPAEPSPLPTLVVADGKGGSRPGLADEEKRVFAALDRCLNVFEDRTDSGVQFPISLTGED